MPKSYATSTTVYEKIKAVLDDLQDDDGDRYFQQVLKGKHAMPTRFSAVAIRPEKISFKSSEFQKRFVTRIFTLVFYVRTSSQLKTLEKLEEIFWEVYDAFNEINQGAGAGETDYSTTLNRTLDGTVYWLEVDDITPTYRETETFIEGETEMSLRVEFDI